MQSLWLYLIAVFVLIEFLINLYINKKNKKIIILFFILSFVILFSSIMLFNEKFKPLEKNNIEIKEQQLAIEELKKQLVTERPDNYYQPDKIVDTKKDEFTKESAITATTNILKLFKGKLRTTKEMKERFKLLAEDSEQFTKYINDKALSKIYLTDIMKNNDAYISTALIMLSLNAQLGEDYKDISPVLSSLDLVYLDKYSKTAKVPFGIYTGTPTAVSFPLIYINGEWKIEPYTLMQSIQLSEMINREKNK